VSIPLQNAKLEGEGLAGTQGNSQEKKEKNLEKNNPIREGSWSEGADRNKYRYFERKRKKTTSWAAGHGQQKRPISKGGAEIRSQEKERDSCPVARGRSVVQCERWRQMRIGRFGLQIRERKHTALVTVVDFLYGEAVTVAAVTATVQKRPRSRMDHAEYQLQRRVRQKGRFRDPRARKRGRLQWKKKKKNKDLPVGGIWRRGGPGVGGVSREARKGV